MCGALQSFPVPNSFLPALFERSRLDPGEFLHYPSSSHAPGTDTRRILTSKQHQKSPFVTISAEKRRRGRGKKLQVSPSPNFQKNSSWKSLDVCNRIPGSDAPPPFFPSPQLPPFLWLHKNKMINYPSQLPTCEQKWFLLEFVESFIGLWGVAEMQKCLRVCFWYAHGAGGSRSTDASPPIPRSASGRMCLIYGRTPL